MSDYESHKGTIKLIPKPKDQEFVFYYRTILEEKNINIREEFKSDIQYLREMIQDELYDKVIFVDSMCWEIVKDSYINPDSDIFEVEENQDGTIDYYVRYYNGGCCLSEAIQISIDKMEKQKK